jgi:predicted ArsR family transcriptional regulator
MANSDLPAVAGLAEPTRAALYRYVASSPGAVGRDEAAEACGLARQVAAYHLDRLAADGLVDVEFKRLSGARGPGAGRPAKLYRRSARSFSVSVPPRRYELAARIMLEALGADDTARSALEAAAHRAGEEIGRHGLTGALVETGYVPVEEEGETRFRNCPFHVLQEQDRRTVCGLNLALVRGIVAGAGESRLRPYLGPEEGYCCVRIAAV